MAISLRRLYLDSQYLIKTADPGLFRVAVTREKGPSRLCTVAPVEIRDHYTHP